jgi:phosphate:Na+ symporter
MWHDVKLWGFLAGLGLFLLGMYMLEQGLRGLGSRSMKKLLREQTRSPLRGVIAGTAVTAFLQSSSLVGLIVLAFVGAGILELRNALGVILGSNLGTTITGWAVAILGFKLDLLAFAHPALALGALGTVFLRQDERPYYLSNLLLGLGLLLLGLYQMTGAFASLQQNVDLSFLRGHNLLLYFLGGVLFTAVIQSSSAAMMVFLAALHTGIFSLTEAIAMVIGSNLGTTSTVMLGAIKGSIEKRRVALSHFFFNLVTVVLALILITPMISFITSLPGLTDPLYALVAFHTLFNLMGIIVFMPFIGLFARFLEWLVPEEKDGGYCSYIRGVPARVTEAAIEAVRKELGHLILQAVRVNLHCFKIGEDDVFPAAEERRPQPRQVFEDEYAVLKRADGEVMSYIYAALNTSVGEADNKQLTHLNHAVRNVTYAVKFIKDIRHNLAEFRHSPSDAVVASLAEMQNEIRIIYRKLVALVSGDMPELIVDHYLELKRQLRGEYERFVSNSYAVSAEGRVDNEEMSSLLNVNRAVYLSTSALLEAVRVLLNIEETPAITAAPVISEA